MRFQTWRRWSSLRAFASASNLYSSEGIRGVEYGLFTEYVKQGFASANKVLVALFLVGLVWTQAFKLRTCLWSDKEPKLRSIALSWLQIHFWRLRVYYVSDRYIKWNKNLIFTQKKICDQLLIEDCQQSVDRNYSN